MDLASSLSLVFANKIYARGTTGIGEESAYVSPRRLVTKCSRNNCYDEENGICKRRDFVAGIGALMAVNALPMSPLLAQGKPENFEVFVDKKDGYSYYYPSDWRPFEFIGHDSAFKDRYMQLQNVRLSFLPTKKTDIHELGPSMVEVVEHLTNDVFAAPSQIVTILGMEEKQVDGKNYCTFEYILTAPHFSRAAFATIAVGNERFYTLIVGANERRWRRFRNQLKVVADSFKVLDI